jgi:ATP-binding cassette subfamily B protein
MDHGEIVERGTHAELIEAAGAYSQMWQMQKRQSVEV